MTTREEFEVRVGRPQVRESRVGTHGAVFEDDGDTGYLYATEVVSRRLRAPKVGILDAFHVYDAATVTDADRARTGVLEWTADGSAVALVLNGSAHVMVDFAAGLGMSVGAFPPSLPGSPFASKAWDEQAFAARFPHLTSAWRSQPRTPGPTPAPGATDGPGDDLGVEPPGPDRVARRAAVLAAVMTRGFIEAEDDLDDPPTVLRDNLAFVADLDLVADMEPGEAALVSAPYGALHPQDRIDAIWRTEGVGMLAWALCVVDDPPPVDETFSPAELGPLLGLPWDGGEDVALVRSPHLRPAVEVERLEAVLRAAHWRVRGFGLRPRHLDFVTFVAGASWGPLELGDLAIVDGDLAIGGAPIASADPELVQTAASILTERRLAVSWLRGHSAAYSAGDTST